jgi:hypothetical protein
VLRAVPLLSRRDSPSPKKAFWETSRKNMLPLQKATSREFTRDKLLLQTGLFKEFQEEMYFLSEKATSREFKAGCAPLNKKTSCRKFRRGYAPPKELFQGIQECLFPTLKKTIPRNSRRDILRLQKGLFKEFRRYILYSLSRKGLFHQ